MTKLIIELDEETTIQEATSIAEKIPEHAGIKEIRVED